MGRVQDLTGQRFGRLTVASFDHKTDSGVFVWRCLCQCGNELLVQRNNLRSGNTQSCGCHRNDRARESQFEDVTGARFGSLTCLEFVGRSKHGAVKWLCMCDCGKRSVFLLNNIKRRPAASCGCIGRAQSAELARELGRRMKGHKHGIRHGQTGTPTYMSWRAMITRTTNPNAANYKNYGGRGIAVCDRWQHNFESFLADMGERPPGCSIGRLDNDGDYEPRNCAWVTEMEQHRNKRNNHLITHQGQTKTLAEWSEVSRIPYEALRMRLKYGWPTERALSEPLKRGDGQ